MLDGGAKGAKHSRVASENDIGHEMVSERRAGAGPRGRAVAGARAVDGARGRVTVIEARRLTSAGFGELWAARDVLVMLAWRDIASRYRQTLLGVAWAIVKPLLSALVLAVFVGRYAGLDGDGLPYPLLVYTGLVPYSFFATAAGNAATSLVRNGPLVTKVYFPRLVLPLAALIAALPDFLIACGFLVALLFYYAVVPTLALLWLPVAVLGLTVLATACGTLLAALNALYRDVQYAVPYGLQLLLFASPVIYGASVVPEGSRGLYFLNPLAALIEGFRRAACGGGEVPVGALMVALFVSCVLLVVAVVLFRRVEERFADSI